MLVAPQFFICLYILITKARRIKNNILILLLVGLLAVVDLTYPLFLILKHKAFVNMQEEQNSTPYFRASAVFLGVFVASFNSAIWIFSLKFWVLSKKLELIHN